MPQNFINLKTFVRKRLRISDLKQLWQHITNSSPLLSALCFSSRWPSLSKRTRTFRLRELFLCKLWLMQNPKQLRWLSTRITITKILSVKCLNSSLTWSQCHTNLTIHSRAKFSEDDYYRKSLRSESSWLIPENLFK